MPKAISKKQVGTARTSLTPQPEALVSEGSEYRAGQAGGATTAAEGTAALLPAADITSLRDGIQAGAA
jgi:hypothetical protein